MGSVTARSEDQAFKQLSLVGAPVVGTATPKTACGAGYPVPSSMATKTLSVAEICAAAKEASRTLASTPGTVRNA